MSLVSKALKGKTVLVTGASKGIGKALCKNLVEVQGCKVIGTGRNKEKLEKVGKELGIKIIEADLSKPEDCDRVAQEAGVVDYLVNAHGAGSGKETFLEMKLETWNQIIQTNLQPIFYLSQQVAKRMVENGRKGAIVSISSIFGKVGGMHKTAYSAAKAGLDGLTRVMALELGAKGIRVNSCHPTAIPTEMGKTGWEDEKKADWLLSRTPLGKFGEVDHVIDSIVFLLNTDSVNGVNLMIDGGFTCAPFCLAETKVSNMSEPQKILPNKEFTLQSQSQ